MRREAMILAGLLAAITAALSGSEAAAQDGGAAPVVPACIQISTDARYVPYGYNHVVVLKSGCSKPAACTVSTDVNPQPTYTEVAAGTTVEVLTYTGSPAQTFHARVACRLR